MRRKRDSIRVETDSGVFDAFQTLEVVNDIAGITEAVMEVGDDGSWKTLEKMVAPGQPFTVYLNGRPRMRGRAEINEVSGQPGSGLVLRLTLRTKLTDARYRSADPVSVQGVTIKQFILSLYGQLGFSEDDFRFATFTDAELMTGKAAGAAPILDLDSMTLEQAKVKPPETIYDAVERHLKRYRATHWDGPLGEILVGCPDDTQSPLYYLQAKRGVASRSNNILSFTRTKDWSEVPSEVVVYGQTFGKDITSSQHKGVAVDDDVDAVRQATGHFNRRVIVQDQQSKNKASAERAARRELSARIRRKDSWDVTLDGWSYWNGSEQIPWANNTMVSLDVDCVGGAHGNYLVVRTSLNLDPSGAATTTLTVVAPGIWVL